MFCFAFLLICIIFAIRKYFVISMKSYLPFVVLLFFCTSILAKVDEAQKISYPGGKCYMLRLMLTDKHDTPFNISHPEAYLSQRAIKRRERQNIKVDSTDLPITPAYLRAIEAKGVKIVGKSRWNNSVLVRSKRSEVVVRLNELPFVKRIIRVFTSPDSINSSKRANFHKDFNEWDVNNNAYGMSYEQVSSLNGNRLHDAGYRGRGMMIAVMDGGFMNVDKIPALQAARIVATTDFVVPRSADIYKEMDHGTMVLSTMATNIPNTYIGTAPEASYVLIRCEDEQTESLAEEDYWVEAAEYADSIGVDVVNSSLGYHDFDDKTTSHKYSEMDGEQAYISHTASMLAGKGIVLVNSAGNDGMGTWKKINFPADARDIITVGSVSSNGVNAAFSAVGPTADGRIKPDVMALGSPASVITGRGTIINDMGTSFSAPIVCGLVACLWQAMPEKTAFEIIDLVRMSGNQAGTPDNVYGYGMPDFWKAYKDLSSRHSHR